MYRVLRPIPRLGSSAQLFLDIVRSCCYINKNKKEKHFYHFDWGKMGAASAVCASSLIRYYGTFVVSIHRPVKDILISDNRGINEMFAGDVSAVCPVSPLVRLVFLGDFHSCCCCGFYCCLNGHILSFVLVDVSRLGIE